MASNTINPWWTNNTFAIWYRRNKPSYSPLFWINNDAYWFAHGGVIRESRDWPHKKDNCSWRLDNMSVSGSGSDRLVGYCPFYDFNVKVNIGVIPERSLALHQLSPMMTVDVFRVFFRRQSKGCYPRYITVKQWMTVTIEKITDCYIITTNKQRFAKHTLKQLRIVK